MTTAAKLAGFMAVLVVAFGAAFGIGRATGPVAATAASHTEAASSGEAGHGGHDEAPATVPATRPDLPGGLMVSQSGYTLSLSTAAAQAGHDVPVSFAITGPSGIRHKAFDVAHDKRLHLIAVRRDFTGYQHVHPTMAADGTWSTALDLTGGTWRLFADFTPTGGPALTLGTDLAVAGDPGPAPAPSASRTAEVDGYTVTLAGDLVPGTDSALTLRVSKDGRPVTDLQPYLAAYGHLVALRGGELAYLHVHPEGQPGDGTTTPGPDVAFLADVPTAGTYHLYLDFQHDGVVRTAAFTIETRHS